MAPEDPGIKICADKTLPDSDNGGGVAPPQREVSRVQSCLILLEAHRSRQWVSYSRLSTAVVASGCQTVCR